jgi:hypothetical protein
MEGERRGRERRGEEGRGGEGRLKHHVSKIDKELDENLGLVIYNLFRFFNFHLTFSIFSFF